MKRPLSVLSLLVAMSLWGPGAPASGADELGKVKTGGAVPPYKLTAVDGRVVDKERNRGRVVIMVCLTPAQKASIRTVSEADRLAGRYEAREVELVVVVSEEVQKTELGDFWLRSGITAPLVLDLEHSIQESFGVLEYPTTIVINAKGRLVHVISGKEPTYFPLLDIYVRHALGKLDPRSMEQELQLRNFITGEGPPDKPDELRKLKVGEPMPPFRLRITDEQVIDGGALAGKAVLMVYVSAGQRNSDAACVDADRVARQLARDDLQLVIVTADVGRRGYFQRVWEEAEISVPLAFDDGRRLYGKLGLVVFPTTLLIDRTGRLRHVITTRRSDYAYLLDAYARHTLGLLDDVGLQERLDSKAVRRGSPASLALRHRAAARQLRNEGRLESAERELRTAIDLDPTSTPIRLDLADLCLKIGAADECLDIVEVILEKEPRHRQALVLRGIGLLLKEDLAGAEEVLLKALDLNPDPARTHFYLGRIYELRGEKDKAIEHYRGAASSLLDE